eukprot:6638058-Alexandrium_andersonii.AAC.1
MSASLVGSEMCIRDRYVDLAKVPAHCGGAEQRSLYLHQFGKTGACSWLCLLYTSDAADDM